MHQRNTKTVISLDLGGSYLFGSDHFQTVAVAQNFQNPLNRFLGLKPKRGTWSAPPATNDKRFKQ
jgi:hypothetical protein